MQSDQMRQVLDISRNLLEAPEDDACWHGAIAGLQTLVGAELGGFVATDDAGGNMLALGGDARFADDYVREFHAIDPFIGPEAIAEPAPVNQCVLTDELISWQRFARTDFYNDYWRRWGNLGHGLGGALLTPTGRTAQFVFLRPRSHPFRSFEIDLCNQMLPYLRAAIDARGSQGLVIDDLSQLTADPVFMLTADSRLLHASPAGHALIDQHASLRVDGGFLRMGTPDRLLPLLAARRRAGSRPQLVPDPLGDQMHHLLISRVSCRPGSRQRTFLLRLRNIQCTERHFAHADLSVLFRFTVTESKVANALLDGSDVEEMAAQWGVRPDTVRGHIKVILRKTGTHTQRHLVRLLANTLPLRTLR